MKILVCEDDVMMLKMIELKLKKDGHEIFTATDGKKGASLVKENTFELVITDLLMPFLSGLELINIVRNELMQTMPIIVLSSVKFEETILKAFELGADDYIVKPFSPNELSIRVKRLSMTNR